MAMASRAQDKGVEYVLNSPARNIEVRDDRVRIKAARQGEGLMVEARAVVIAIGFGSPLIRGLDLGKISHFAMGAQAEVETVGIDEIEVYFGQKIAPGFFAWLVPTLPHRALARLLSRHSLGFYLKRLMSALLAQGKIVSDEAELRYSGVPLRPLARTYGERLLVVGSAAGQVKPTTGGGIYYGLLCANIAADNLHQTLETNTLSARSMANYEREWRRKLGRELKMDYWARRFYEHLSDRQIDKVFDIIKSNGIDNDLLNADDVSFDWHGEAMLRLLRHRAVSNVIKVMRIPFQYFK